LIRGFFRGKRMIAAVVAPVASLLTQSSSTPSSFIPPRIERRQHRQRFLEWDRDEAAEARRMAVSRTAAPTEPSSFDRVPVAGPRRMGDIMPDVLARYGLKL
jgi:hypothetical protein